MLSRSSEMPVSIVLTFQVPSFRDGLISVFLKVPGVVNVLLFGFWPSLLHPKRHVVKAGKSPYLLGAAQLKEGGIFPIGSENPSHRRQGPVALFITAIRQSL